MRCTRASSTPTKQQSSSRRACSATPSQTLDVSPERSTATPTAPFAAARAALRAWIIDPPEATTPVSVHRERPPNTRQPTTSRPTEFRPGTVDNRSIRPTAIDQTPTEPHKQPLLLTPIDAARLLSISRSKLYTLIKREQIHSVRIDTARRIPYSELVAYIDKLRHPCNECVDVTENLPEQPLSRSSTLKHPAVSRVPSHDLELTRQSRTVTNSQPCQET